MADIAAGSVRSLRARLQEAERKTDADWIGSLSPRKLAELRFHDHWREATRGASQPAIEAANQKYYSTVGASRRYTAEWIARHAQGKVFLDYACGNGANTIEAAKAGAALAIGLDISRVSIENARQRAAEAGVAGNTCFVQGDCEDTGLPSESIDAVICNGMLHHLDLSYAFPELRRILKPGGVCLAIEALNYNPAIKLYRLLTPRLRTDWEKEHILSLKDLAFARRFFEVADVRYWHLASILATPCRGTRLFGPLLRAGDAVDSLLLRVFPLSLLAWIFTFELRKRLAG